MDCEMCDTPATPSLTTRNRRGHEFHFCSTECRTEWQNEDAEWWGINDEETTMPTTTAKPTRRTTYTVTGNWEVVETLCADCRLDLRNSKHVHGKIVVADVQSTEACEVCVAHGHA